MIRQVLFLLLLVSVSVHGNTQNLISNPSFENVLSLLPNRTDTAYCYAIMNYWEDSSWTIRSSSYAAIIRNGESRHGDYAAVITIYNTRNLSRHYLQTKLKQEVKKGREYQLNLFAKLYCLSFGGITTSAIDCHFTKTPTDLSIGKILLTPILSNNNEAFVKTDDWIKISFTFKAEDNYNYLIIGNFSNQQETKLKKINPFKLGSVKGEIRVLIDSISLIELEANSYANKVLPENNATELDRTYNNVTKYVLNKSYFLNDIHFKHDNYSLDTTSCKEIDSLLIFLIQDKDVSVVIIGHTDNSGIASYNQWLSEKRAKSVVEYLIHKNIYPERISYVGKGDTDPIASNNEKDGRLLNRRVEFVLVKLSK